jgi:hypothetical protein
MGTGAKTQEEETKGGASQSRDVIPELLLLVHPRPDRLQLKGDRYTYQPWGQFFFQLQIRYLAYQVFNNPRSIATVVYGALHQISDWQ